MEKIDCTSCRLPRADRRCGVCDADVCRRCIERLAEDAFELREALPAELSHSEYCPRCYDVNVAPAIEQYNSVLERAKEVGFWTRTYRGFVPVLGKSDDKISVEGGRDRDDVLLKLGFKAAELGFNGLIRGELVGKKIHKENARGYQTMVWSASGLPAHVDKDKLDREEFREAHWRTLHHR